MRIAVYVMMTGNHQYYRYSQRAIDRYYAPLGISVHYQREMPEELKGLSYCWGRYHAHRVIDADVIISQDADILPCSTAYDIREHISGEKFSMPLDPYAPVLQDNESLRFKNFKYNAGLMFIPKSFQPMMELCVYEYARPGTDAKKWDDAGDQYCINDFVARHNIDVDVIPSQFDTFWTPGMDYSKLAFVHYTGQVPSGGHKHEYITQFHPKEMIQL